MKKYMWFWIMAFIAALPVNPVYAEKTETVAATPSHLTVTGTRGTTETRTLLLRTEKAITNVKVLALDLPRTDGNVVLQMSAIQAAPAKNSADPQTPLSIPISFSLKDAPSGEFKGELWISHDDGSLTIPVTVKVKDRPWWALIVLILGIGLSLGVSNYRARGKPRDEVLVRVGQVRAQMRGDRDLHEQFRSRIKGAFIDVEVAVQAEKWDEAREAVEKSETYWAKWRKGRSDWLAQFQYQATLQERFELLEESYPQTSYIQILHCELEGVLRNSPDLTDPDAFRQQLNSLAQQIDCFRKLSEHIDHFNQKLYKLSADDRQKEVWRLKALEFQRTLDNLKPDNRKGYENLQTEIDKALAALEQEIAKHVSRGESFSKGVSDFDNSSESEMIPPAPFIQTPISKSPAHKAKWRLTWFQYISYAIAVLFLAGAGFGELYVGNSAFGAHAWGDYLALLAWGFGAEATRASVTDMVKGWGIK